ncbi:TIGR01459 family HAD-type hydrolase [Hyphobacterium sp. SN044]|uniref:TIGR01459 family HAD-type hydrolase n=1 Tax=Hyphobacterium sp. SN044 TaxID=2912575 RepID=UPI001F472484|nr:TIGR01459 family HAD-type hydrolase [Hyphobacterium sp. SN044]MCF8880576.1 TIGR01459 family HAD-type hydrolase [Hyphobacterium sp. SN044]
MEHAPRLSEIADRYDAILCDVWGVIRDGRTLLPEAIEALRRYRANHGPVVLISNSPQPAPRVAAQLASMGAPDDAWDDIVTSGDTTLAAIRELGRGPVFHIGPPGYDDALFEFAALDFAPLDDAAYVVCTGLKFDRRDEHPDDYRDMLAAMKARGLPMVCANPDIVVQWGDDLLWCAGALARLYREMGGETVISGKPHTPIYELAFEVLAEAGHHLDRSRVLAIGDGPETDLIGAERNGLDGFFVAGGILGGDLDLDRFDPEAVGSVLEEYGTRCRWAAAQLKW